MLRVQPVDPNYMPIVVLESSLEYDTAAEAVKDIDPKLAETLGGISLKIHLEGLAPETTRLLGQAATKVITGLETVSNEPSVTGLCASIILEDAAMVDVDTSDLETWAKGDLIAKLQALPEGPHSAEITVVDQATGEFTPVEDWLHESRRVPAEIF